MATRHLACVFRGPHQRRLGRYVLCLGFECLLMYSAPSMTWSSFLHLRATQFDFPAARISSSVILSRVLHPSPPSCGIQEPLRGDRPLSQRAIRVGVPCVSYVAQTKELPFARLSKLRFPDTYEAGRLPRRPGLAMRPMYLCDPDPVPDLNG